MLAGPCAPSRCLLLRFARSPRASAPRASRTSCPRRFDDVSFGVEFENAVDLLLSLRRQVREGLISLCASPSSSGTCGGTSHSATLPLYVRRKGTIWGARAAVGCFEPRRVALFPLPATHATAAAMQRQRHAPPPPVPIAPTPSDYDPLAPPPDTHNRPERNSRIVIRDSKATLWNMVIQGEVHESHLNARFVPPVHRLAYARGQQRRGAAAAALPAADAPAAARALGRRRRRLTRRRRRRRRCLRARRHRARGPR